MPRSRNIKPAFFVNEDLTEMPFETRLLFIGLWTLADRKGRLEHRSRKIKMSIFPENEVDIEGSLKLLHAANLIVCYEVNKKAFIQIVNFEKHQSPHYKEPPSTIPPPDSSGIGLGHARDLPDASLGLATLIPESGSLNYDCGPPSQDRVRGNCEIFVETVLKDIERVMGVKLENSQRVDWERMAVWGWDNALPPENVTECYELLTQQKWRDGPVKAHHVMEYLPNLEKLRDEIRRQNSGKRDIEKPEDTNATLARIRANPAG